jgi:putative endonuclease
MQFLWPLHHTPVAKLVEGPSFYQKNYMWHVYIIKCSDNTLYTGSTTDLNRRLKEHNSDKGGSYTRIRKPVELVYKESHPNRSKAQKREAHIKGLTREKKLTLIEGQVLLYRGRRLLIPLRSV